MANFLRHFDQVSYLLGLLTGALLTWLLGKLRPLLARIFAAAKSQSQASRQERRLGDEIRLANDTIRLSQSWHLASPLFSLDEILIAPRVLAPPATPMAYEPSLSEDITDWTIPCLPDWPELASFYGAPSLSLAEALKGGANLIVTGQPGNGKTVALAHLAIQIARRDSLEGELVNLCPMLLHVADLDPFPQNLEDPITTLLNAVSSYATSIPRKRLPGFVQTILKQGRALLLLDGLDELPPQLLMEVTQFLARLLEMYPSLRAVVAASPNNLGNLLHLGFQALPLVSWNQEQRTAFIQRWSDLWNRFVVEPDKSKTPRQANSLSYTDSLLLTGWLSNNSANLTPLELTLKVWAAFAGDSLGPSSMAAFEAYLRRMTARQPEKNRPALEQLASQMVLTMQPVIDTSNAERWLGGADMVTRENELATEQANTISDEQTSRRAPVRARGALPDLIESNLIALHTAERITLVHPVLTGYLVSRALASTGNPNLLAAQTEWTGKSISLQYLSILDPSASWIGELAKEKDDDPLLSELFGVSRWLRGAPEDLTWIPNVLRRLAGYLQQETLPLAIRGRALTALVLSGHTGVEVLLHQMLSSSFPIQRQLAALGCGFLHETKSMSEISKLINDPSPQVNRAAILALVAIDGKHGLEAVAYTLLHGDESLRRSAAEALTNHTEEGLPTLEEGSTLQDPAVRRAVVFGLGRIGKLPMKQHWAISILEKMHTQDSQWVVQDAALQMLQDIRVSNPRLPRPLPPLTHTAWLISFAAERGMGIAPGKPAHEMLYRSLAEGNEDQRIAAIYCLSQYGDEAAILPLYQMYFSSSGEIREHAFNALWNLAASGVSLPPPAQYGLH